MMMMMMVCLCVGELPLTHAPLPLTSTWPHLNSDVGLEEGEY